MRKSIAFKTLLRAPVKMLLTFLLIAAASFALFSKIAEFSVTHREAAKAESFYSGVAALDNTVPPVEWEEEIDGVEWHCTQEIESKPWPTDEQIKEFTSLPGVTLADTRYMTAGMIADCKRLKGDLQDLRYFILEGTYDGYKSEQYMEGCADLSFRDVAVLGGDIDINPDFPTVINAVVAEELQDKKNPYSLEFFEKLEKGSRCLVLGAAFGDMLTMNPSLYPGEELLRVVDGQGDGYLETEEFASYKGWIDVIQQTDSVYDIVYTSDMRAIPRFNERKMLISSRRPLTAEDTDSCVVSEDFLKAYGFSIGDKIDMELGDRLVHQSYATGATPMDAEHMSGFAGNAELEIVGAYCFADSDAERLKQTDWSYSASTVFVPASLLPVEVPEDYETAVGEFSVFIENARDIQAFREAAEPLVGEMGVGMRFSDGGWNSMKDNFETGFLASYLTAALYVFGAALALLLAVYLYVGRNKNTYAIMRTLGVPGKKAGSSMTLPLCILSVPAMLCGGLIGFSYASYTAAGTLAGMSDSSAPDGYAYVLDAEVPVGVAILCLCFELLFFFAITQFFLRQMKKTPPLELLQEHPYRSGAGTRVCVTDIAGDAPVPAALDIAGLPLGSPELAASSGKGAAAGKPRKKKYGAFRQVTDYILRHIRRGVGKTAVSLALAVVLSAGIGTFVLARLTYQDAYREMDVQGKAMKFASSSVAKMSKSALVKDLYYYDSFGVRVNGGGFSSPMAITNDFGRYLEEDCKITYVDWMDSSVFEGDEPVCLVGKEIAEAFGIQPGKPISLMSDEFYAFMQDLYEGKDEEKFEKAVLRASKYFTVAGILESKDAEANNSIYTSACEAADELYGQPFPISYCEFILADNTRLAELETLLDWQSKESMEYSPLASFHIDSESFENVKRVRGLLESLFPIAVTAAVLIGLFGPGLVILQSAQEAAFLRFLGVTKKRARCMLVIEQIVLCIAGVALVAAGLALFRPGMFARSTQTLILCWALYFMGCLCGALAAAVQVTRHRILELLQVKE